MATSWFQAWKSYGYSMFPEANLKTVIPRREPRNLIASVLPLSSEKRPFSFPGRISVTDAGFAWSHADRE